VRRSAPSIFKLKSRTAKNAKKCKERIMTFAICLRVNGVLPRLRVGVVPDKKFGALGVLGGSHFDFQKVLDPEIRTSVATKRHETTRTLFRTSSCLLVAIPFADTMYVRFMQLPNVVSRLTIAAPFQFPQTPCSVLPAPCFSRVIFRRITTSDDATCHLRKKPREMAMLA